MLRASTLGLRDYHDTSRSIFWLCNRRLLSVLVTHVLVDTGNSRGTPDASRETMADRRAQTPIALQNDARTRINDLPPAEIPRPHGMSTVTQISPTPAIAKSISSFAGIPPIRSQTAEKTSGTRTAEAGFMQSVHPITWPTSQRSGTSKDGPSMSLDEVDPVSLDVSPPSPSEDDPAYYLQVLETTASAKEAWDAYEYLRALASANHAVNIRYAHLHRLSRLLCRVKPRTRTLFLQLLSVLSDLHQRGGKVRLWQWNALLDCAGKGWRKTPQADFQTALDIYEDMVAQRAPGATFYEDEHGPSYSSMLSEYAVPDIVTYTTLINIAGRTRDERSVHRALSLLESSHLSPNRITYLSLIRYFTRTKQLTAVRKTLHTMKEKGLELGIDGINACIWAYGFNQQLDIASTVYRVLRHNYQPEVGTGAQEIEDAVRLLSTHEGLDILPSVIPDAITYHTMIQVYAYQGDFAQCIQTFIDMVSFPDNTNIIADPSEATSPSDSGVGSPTLAAYRAIFLGFARHGQPSSQTRNSSLSNSDSSTWNEHNLYILFHTFLQLPDDVKPSDRTIYWLLKGFRTTIGPPSIPENYTKLRRVWDLLEDRYGGRWGGRIIRFRRELDSP